MPLGNLFLLQIKVRQIWFLSIEAFEGREKMLAHRASILEAEFSRLSGAPTYTMEQIRGMVKEKFRHAQSEN